MPPPSRFARPVAPLNGDIYLQSSLDHQLTVTVPIVKGMIPDATAWTAIFRTFGISLPPFLSTDDSCALPTTDESSLTTEQRSILMAFLLDKKSSLCVDRLQPTQTYLFDVRAAVTMFGRSTEQKSEEHRSAQFNSVGLHQEGCHPTSFRLFYDDRMASTHVPANPRIPEGPARVTRAYEALSSHQDIGPLLNSVSLPCRLASVEEIAKVHPSDAHRAFLSGEANLAELLNLKSDVYATDTSYMAVRLACGASMDAAEWVWSAHQDEDNRKDDAPAGIRSAFCLIRPPGHHCTGCEPSGFCLVNNVVVAARSLQAAHGPMKISIIDLDVHHGEGTQQLVEEDHSIQYISLHRFDGGQFYPYGMQGSASHVGPHGNVVNIPFDTAVSDPDRCFAVMSDYCFLRAWERLVEPALSSFSPNVIFVSLGFDAALGDPLGAMAVEDGFGQFIGSWLLPWAKKQSDCRGVVCLLEGGYNVPVVMTQCCSVVSSMIWSDSACSTLRGQIPKTWDVLREKLQRGASSSSPLMAEEGDDGVQGEGSQAERACSQSQPKRVVLTNEELWERHVQWTNETMERVLDARKQALHVS